MSALVTSGACNTLDAFYMLCAADSQAAGLNWINTGFPMVPVNSPTFTADQGYQGDGSTSYLNTKYNAVTDATFFSQNNACIGATAVTNSNAAGLEFGYSNASNPACTGGFRNSSDLSVMAINHSTASLDASVSQTDSRFVLIGSRTGGSVATTYKNGSSIASSVVAATGSPNGELYVCARNNAGTPDCSTKRIAHFMVGGSMDATMAAAVSAAIKAYVNGCTPGLLP